MEVSDNEENTDLQLMKLVMPLYSVDISDCVSYSTREMQKVFARRVADMVADRGLELAAWDDGMYADGHPDPITDFKSRLVLIDFKLTVHFCIYFYELWLRKEKSDG